MNFFRLLTLTLDIVSAGSALAVILLFFAIKRYDYAAIDRVSIRLQLGIAFVDFAKHFMGCIAVEWGETACSAIGFLTSLLLHIYIGMNLCIAMNLMLVILCNRKPQRKWEILYWVSSTTLPVILNVPLLGIFTVLKLTSKVSRGFGKNSAGKCFFRDVPSTSPYLHFIYNAGFLSLTIIYCLMVSVMVIYKVKRERDDQSDEGLINPAYAYNKASILSFKSLICRTCLYPMSCFLAYIVYNISGTYYFIFSTRSSFLLNWGRFGYCSRGMLHLFSFLADPMVNKAISKLLQEVPKEASSSQKDISHIDDSSGCDISYGNIAGPIISENPSPALKKMIMDLQRYI